MHDRRRRGDSKGDRRRRKDAEGCMGYGLNFFLNCLCIFHKVVFANGGSRNGGQIKYFSAHLI